VIPRCFPDRYSPWPHRLAVLLAAVTFPLIWVGGLVTTYDAGMAVPDWPNTYGYNLLLYPWTTWVYGPWNLFIEHGHRLLGMVAGMVSIGLMVVTWRCDSRRWVRWLSVGALVLVCVQGGLGGARVLLDQRTLALIHGCVGPAFFAYVVGLIAVTSRWWHTAGVVEHPQAGSVQRLTWILTGLAYFQLILGAHLRHAPPDGSPEVFRAAVVFHLGFALILLGHMIAASWKSWQRGFPPRLRWALTGLLVLVLAQIGLGSSVWILKYGWPMGLSETWQVAGTTVVARSFTQSMTTTAHVAMGSLILAGSLWSSVCCRRCFWISAPLVSSGVMQWGMAR
jgi:heme a synthase